MTTDEIRTAIQLIRIAMREHNMADLYPDHNWTKIDHGMREWYQDMEEAKFEEEHPRNEE